MTRVPRPYPARFEGDRLYVTLSPATWANAKLAAARRKSKTGDKLKLTEVEMGAVELVLDEFVSRMHARESWTQLHDLRDLLSALAKATTAAEVRSVLIKDGASGDVVRSLGRAKLEQRLYRFLRHPGGVGHLTPDDVRDIAKAATRAWQMRTEALGHAGRPYEVPELLHCLGGLAWVFDSAGGEIAANRIASRLGDHQTWSPFVRWIWELLQDTTIPQTCRPSSIDALGKVIERALPTLKTATRPAIL